MTRTTEINLCRTSSKVPRPPRW